MGARAAAGFLPVCDHYCGVEARMVKSLALQAEMTHEFGVCVFDVTLDCEDGAPVGGELDHANMVVALANSSQAASKNVANRATRNAANTAANTAINGAARVAVRVHPVDHPAFESDIRIIVGGAGAALSHVMIPKVESLADIELAVMAIDAAGSVTHSRTPGGAALAANKLPLHVLLESPAAVHRAFDIAAHPRVQSISFGLMDFVSAHGGAIPAHGMSGNGQFTHPLVVRAKLDIASACHAHGKVPSHSVVTEFKDTVLMESAARRAAQEFGYTRMWSIHPDQIRPILRAMAPDEQEVDTAARVILAASAANWAPIAFDGKLQDRASYRYFWRVLERAHQTGCPLPEEARVYFADDRH